LTDHDRCFWCFKVQKERRLEEERYAKIAAIEAELATLKHV